MARWRGRYRDAAYEVGACTLQMRITWGPPMLSKES